MTEQPNTGAAVVETPERPRWWKVWMGPLMVLVTLVLSLFAHTPAFASSGGGIPPVQYGTGTGAGLATKVTSATENMAETIRLMLGGTALVVILVAAIMNHFVHDERAKMRAKELISAAVVGLLLAAFAPSIVNFITSL